MRRISMYLFASVLVLLIPAAALAQYGGGGGGGGGGRSAPPTVSQPQGLPAGGQIVVVINGSADPTQVTASTEVKLGLPQTTADQMAISNSLDFGSSSWMPYQGEKDWTLTPELGRKEVYVKFRDSRQGTVTGAYSGVINLVTSGAPTNDTVDASEPAAGTDERGPQSGDAGSCELTPGNVYKAANSSAVYYVLSGCTKRPFTNPSVYFTYFNSWSDVIVTTQDKLNSVPNDAIRFMPWGPKFNPRYGALVKVVEDPKVYVLLNGNKYWITSETVFGALYYQWPWIEDVDARVLTRYAAAGEITDTTRHPEHTIIKFNGSPRVYRVENGEKRHILDEGAFTRLGYRFDRVLSLPEDSFVYSDGPDLE